MKRAGAHHDRRRSDTAGDCATIGRRSVGRVAALLPALADSPQQGCHSAMVVESSFASYQELGREKLAQFGVPGFLRAPLGLLVDRRRDPAPAAARVRVPALVIHGDADPVVPLSQGQGLFDALGSPDKTFVPLPGAGHTPSFGDGGPLEAQVAAFYAAHTAGRAP